LEESEAMTHGDVAVDLELAALEQLARRGLAAGQRGEIRVAQRAHRVDLLRIAAAEIECLRRVRVLDLELDRRADLLLEARVIGQPLGKRREDPGRLRLGLGRRGRRLCRRCRLRRRRRAAARFGSSLRRNSSICDAITLPEILSLPVENSFIASALPDVMSRKSRSAISSVVSAAASPGLTLPPAVLTSSTHGAPPIFHW